MKKILNEKSLQDKFNTIYLNSKIYPKRYTVDFPIKISSKKAIHSKSGKTNNDKLAKFLFKRIKNKKKVKRINKEKLFKSISSENLHDEVDWGKPIGKEFW
jgi:antitoxin component of MazEF toxin-antitoxin module